MEPLVERGEDHLSVRYRWKRGSAWLQALVAVAAVVLVIAAGPETAQLVGVGVIATFFAYSAASGLLNTTSVEVRSGQLRVSHGPVPWPGLSLDIAQLEQLYVRPRAGVSRRAGRRLVRTGQEHAFWASYELVALDKGGRTHTLVRGFNDRVAAQKIEDAVEDFLGIVDVPMPDEAPKDRA